MCNFSYIFCESAAICPHKQKPIFFSTGGFCWTLFHTSGLRLTLQRPNDQNLSNTTEQINIPPNKIFEGYPQKIIQSLLFFC